MGEGGGQVLAEGHALKMHGEVKETQDAEPELFSDELAKAAEIEMQKPQKTRSIEWVVARGGWTLQKLREGALSESTKEAKTLRDHLEEDLGLETEELDKLTTDLKAKARLVTETEASAAGAVILEKFVWAVRNPFLLSMLMEDPIGALKRAEQRAAEGTAMGDADLYELYLRHNASKPPRLIIVGI